MERPVVHRHHERTNRDSDRTFPGLSKQGELNVDVLDQDACNKLQKWFEDRWSDQWCIDITNELIEIQIGPSPVCRNRANSTWMFLIKTPATNCKNGLRTDGATSGASTSRTN